MVWQRFVYIFSSWGSWGRGSSAAGRTVHDEEFEPSGLSCCGELVEELSQVNHKRGEHPGNGEDGPLGVVMVRVTVIQS